MVFISLAILVLGTMVPGNVFALAADLEDPSPANDKLVPTPELYHLRNGDTRRLQEEGEQEENVDSEGETTATVNGEDESGIETTATVDDNGDVDGDNDGETAEIVDGEGESDGETSEILAPGDNADSGDKLPFLTDKDVKCMDATVEFRSSNAGLASAIKTFEESQVLDKNENDGVDIMGYSGEAVEAMKSACGLKKGHWAFVKGAKFTCVIAGMETVAMHVHNFGSCLAKTDDCLDMDPISLLRTDLVDMGFNCWEDEDAAGGDSASPSKEDAEVESESGEGAEEKVENSGTDEDADSAMLGFFGNDSTHNDTRNAESMETGQDATILDSSLMSEYAKQCKTDSVALAEEYPELARASENFNARLDTKHSDEHKVIRYFMEEAEKLKAVCDRVNGYFSFIEEATLSCELMSLVMDVKFINHADCLADTDECKKMDPFGVLEDSFKTMRMTCKTTAATIRKDTIPSIPNTLESDNSDKDDNQEDVATNEDGNKSSSDGELPSSNMIAVVVGVVAVVGLVGFFRYRASHARERNSMSSYEMTDISDLGFSAFKGKIS